MLFRPLTSDQIDTYLNFKDKEPQIEIDFAKAALQEWTKYQIQCADDFDTIHKYRPGIWNGEFEGKSLKGAIQWLEEIQTEFRIATQNVTYWRNRLKNLLTPSQNGQTYQNIRQDWT